METITTTETTSNPSVVVPPVVVTQPNVVIPAGALNRAENRRDWAFYVLAGGGIAMTVMAGIVLWLLQHYESIPLIALSLKYTFWMGMSAMATILVLFTGIGGLLVKRSVNLSRSGLVLEDKIDHNQSS